MAHGATVTEVTVRRDLMKAFRQHLPEALTLRHEDLYTAGIPDLSVSHAGKTSWWEIKYADPYCKTTRIQQHTCTQLDTQGFCCRYLVFRRGHNGKWPRQIRVLAPEDFHCWRHLGIVVSTGAFDYVALVDYIKKLHLL